MIGIARRARALELHRAVHSAGCSHCQGQERWIQTIEDLFRFGSAVDHGAEPLFNDEPLDPGERGPADVPERPVRQLTYGGRECPVCGRDLAVFDTETLEHTLKAAIDRPWLGSGARSEMPVMREGGRSAC